jgi:hypothetical protein
VYVLGSFLFHDFCWQAQSDIPVQIALSSGTDGVITKTDDDIVAQEACGLGGGMSDQGFLLGEFQLEPFAQEVPQDSFDLLRFRFRASKAKKGVVGIADVFESSEVRIVRISSG